MEDSAAEIIIFSRQTGYAFVDFALS